MTATTDTVTEADAETARFHGLIDLMEEQHGPLQSIRWEGNLLGFYFDDETEFVVRDHDDLEIEVEVDGGDKVLSWGAWVDSIDVDFDRGDRARELLLEAWALAADMALKGGHRAVDEFMDRHRDHRRELVDAVLHGRHDTLLELAERVTHTLPCLDGADQDVVDEVVTALRAAAVDAKVLDRINWWLGADEWPGASGMEDVAQVVRTVRDAVRNPYGWDRH